MNAPGWRELIGSMIEAIWIVDPIELRIIGANRSAGILLGLDPDMLVGRSVIDLASTPEDLFFWEEVAAGLSDHIHSETLQRRQDGTMAHVERRISRIWLDPNHPVFVVSMQDQSGQRRVENELEKLVSELRATLESTADGILVTDMTGSIRGYNQRFAQMWQLPSELLTKRDDDAVYQWMREQVLECSAYDQRMMSIKEAPLLQTADTLKLRSGNILEWVTLPQYGRGQPIGRVYSYRDITQRLADESRLRLAAKVFESSLDAIFVMDPNHVVIEANGSCERITGQSREQIIGSSTHDLVHHPKDPSFNDLVEERLESDGYWEGELCHRKADGQTCPGQVSMVRVPDEHGNTLHHVMIFKDLTEKLAAKKRIEELAYTDALTGLPNRLVLAERVEDAMAIARRDHTEFALLFIDLDQFKRINDSLGHLFGDRVLVEVCNRINNWIWPVDTLVRLGGDEFVLLLHQANAQRAEAVARRVLETVSKPLTLDDMCFTLTCSIGIALFPQEGQSMSDLIKNADAAMYRVKDRGRAGFRFYQPQMNVDLLTRVKIDHAMRQALERDDFRLNYQPQVCLKTGEIVGGEALIRWHDNELGEVPPGQFIPVAEETGFIVAIGNWVLSRAVRQSAEWYRRGHPTVVSVNVSALQFRQTDFVEQVDSILTSAGLPHQWLELELTESILIQDVEEVLNRLQALAKLGVRLAIDDFGTGYSSLGYLKRFPIKKLKIDRSFVNGLPSDESDVGIVRAIVNVAKALQLKVIAEGVESNEQRSFLRSIDCDEFQGFLFAHALEPTEFEEVLCKPRRRSPLVLTANA